MDTFIQSKYITTKILSVKYPNYGVHVALLPRSSSRINISAIINNGLQLNEGLFINYNEYTLSRDKVSCKQWAIIDEDKYIRMQVRE